MPKSINIAILGAGFWAVENHIPVLQAIEGVEVSGVCTLGKPALKHIRQKFGISFATEDSRELLSLPGLDGVVVSSPHHLHFEHARSALERGLSVICEKPMTLRADEARRLETLVQDSGKHFLVAFGWNYDDFAAEAKRQIEGNSVGEVLHVHCHMASALLDLFSGDGAWFAENSVIKPEMSTWSNPATGGGFAHGQLTHALGLLFYMTGFSPAQVFAMMQRSKSGADLSNAICCRFTNGATGTIGGAATMPPGSTYQLDIRVFGKSGMLMFDLERPRLELRRHDGQHFRMEMTAKPGEYNCKEPLHTFVRLLRNETVENKSPVSVGRKTVELLDAAFRSVQSGKPEDV